MTTATTTAPTYVQELFAVKQLVPSTLKQPRQTFNKTTIDELAADIKHKGVLQPLLVRPHAKDKNKREIVCGERRWRAAQLAGVAEVPVIVRALTDQEATEAQIAENLQREDIHELEEAVSYQALLATAKCSVAELAARVSKDVGYVTRRLSLNNLIEPARKDFFDGHITLGHALELAAREPGVQQQALDHIYGGRGAHQRRQKEAGTVKDLRWWLQNNTEIDLSKAPWPLDDATLVPAQGACTTCAFRTGTTPGLFPDAGNDNLCTNPEGYKTKMKAWFVRAAAAIKEKTGQDPLYVSTEYSATSWRVEKLDVPNGTIFRDSGYQAVTGKGCQFAVPAIIVENERGREHRGAVGQQIRVCVTKSCKDHAGRVNAVRDTGGYQRETKSVAEVRRRKQELFDLKVNELTRQAIFRDALAKLPTFGVATKEARTWLERVALHWLMRIPSHTVEVINLVLDRGVAYPDDDKTGGTKENKNYLSGNVDFEGDEDQRKPNKDTAKLINALSHKDLARLLCLMSFAHFGENEFKHHQQDQSAVVALAKELGLNYALRDAEARLELSSRKARPTHEAYLAAVAAGKKPPVPSIYVDDKKKPATKAKAKKATKAKGKPAKAKATAGGKQK